MNTLDFNGNVTNYTQRRPWYDIVIQIAKIDPKLDNVGLELANIPEAGTFQSYLYGVEIMANAQNKNNLNTLSRIAHYD